MGWKRFLPQRRLCVLFVLLSAPQAVADDRKDCRHSDDPAAFEACSRLIDAKQLRGQELAAIHLTRGALWFFKKNDADAAIKDYGEAIRIAPGFAQAYVDRGFVYGNNKKDYDRAIVDFTSALRIDPKHQEALVRRASAHSSKAQYDRAIDDYNTAISLFPQEASQYFSRGSVYYYYKKDYDRAIADFDRAIRLNPKSATYVASRGEAYEKKGQLDKAVEDFRAALAIEADNRWAIEGLARLGKTAAAPQAPPPAAPAATAGTPNRDRDICLFSQDSPDQILQACADFIRSGTAEPAQLAES